MKKNFLRYTELSLKNFVEAVVNFFIFLPYFFSVSSLTKTLFFPWKNLVTTRKSRAFYFNEWIETISFNLVSRVIGLIMRLSIVIFYFIILVLYILLLPLIFIAILIFIPPLYLKYSLEKTNEEKEKIFREEFVKKHLLKEENLVRVNQWFDQFYSQLNLAKKWWKLTNLLTIPPLGRDWSVGYTPLLDQYIEDLSSTSYQEKIKSAYDREKEIEQIERSLSKSAEANVIIIGDEGVGKHTIVDSLAKKIYEGRVNNLLAYKRVLKLNFEKILNQSTDQKQRENSVEQLLAEACQAKNVILLIENFDKYVTTGQNRIDLTGPIEKYAKTNKLQIIAISQPFFYQKYIFPVEKINRLFTKIDVYEIKKDEAEQILLQKTIDFEKRYRLIIPYETVKTTIDKSDFYITHIPFPEKAIALLDSICVYVKEKDSLSKKEKIIYPDAVDFVLSEITHHPTSLSEQMKEKLIHLEHYLSSNIIQQQEAIKKLSSALRRSFLVIGKRKKPLASFLFLGPTGVGKTETAKAIATIFFNSSLIRFDMSNYQSKTDIPNLIGSLESGNPGLLTTAIRENPYGVLLLDEMEKADNNLLNIFLTIIDEGYFTDGSGKRVDCKNLTIIATSNAGGEIIFNQQSAINNQQIINHLVKQRIFSPEFLNRFDGIIVYQPLNQTSITQLAKKYITQISDDIYKLHQVKIIISEQLLTTVIQKGYDPQFGARNLERVIRDEIEDRVAKLILENKVKPGETISL